MFRRHCASSLLGPKSPPSRSIRGWRARRFPPAALLVLAFQLAACTARTPRTASNAEDDVPPSAGAQCLKDAAAERRPPESAARRIHVAHILVRHAELKEAQGARRTRVQACLRALAALDALAEPDANFDAVAATFSDSKSADLGWIHAEDVTPAFAAAAFELEAREASYVVETDRGFHIIVRKE